MPSDTAARPITVQSRPVNGTCYEAIKPLRPHPRIVPTYDSDTKAHHRDTTSTTLRGAYSSGEPWSNPSVSIAIDSDFAPPSRSSPRRQYGVASSRVLGNLARLDTDLPTVSSVSSASNPTPNPPSSVVSRTKTLFSPRSSVSPSVDGGEKKHGTFCRTRSMLKKAFDCEKHGQPITPTDVFRLGVYPAPTASEVEQENKEKAEDPGMSIVSEEPFYIAPLRWVPKVSSMGTMSNTVNDGAAKSGVAEYSSYKDEGEDNEDESLYVAPLRLRSSFVTSTSSPRLRRTGLSHTPGVYCSSLRTRYLTPEAESKPPVLNASQAEERVKAMSSRSEDRAEKALRITPSLEQGLGADNFEVYDENALATAAPIIRGISPDVVHIWHSQIDHETQHEDCLGLDRQQLDQDVNTGLLLLPNEIYLASSGRLVTVSTVPLTLPPEPATSTASARVPSVKSKRVSVALSSSDVSVVTPTMPFEVLETIAVTAVYGDAECQSLVSKLYSEVAEAETSGAESRWGVREQALIRKTDLLLDLDLLVRHGYLRYHIFETVRQQLFPIGGTELLGMEEFSSYIHSAVSSFELDDERAKHILSLTTGDESSEMCSVEETIFSRRRPFSSEGFVYAGDDMYDNQYRRLSIATTICTNEPAEPQPLSGCKPLHFLSKVVNACQSRQRRHSLQNSRD